jgi:hypothetical protein
VLTFIAAPAILTNASSVMGLATANRFARAIDRARALGAEIKGRDVERDAEARLRARQMRVAERRALLLVRALSAFYLSVGSFAAASLASLLGAVLFSLPQEAPRHAAMVAALCSGVLGVGGLVCGAALLVRETRLALAILHEETDFVRESLTKQE